MSDAIKKLHDYLAESPSVVYPEDVLAYLSAIEAENAKLRELLADTLMQPRDYCQKYGIEYESWDSANVHLDARLRELGVEVPDGD